MFSCYFRPNRQKNKSEHSGGEEKSKNKAANHLPMTKKQKIEKIFLLFQKCSVDLERFLAEKKNLEDKETCLDPLSKAYIELLQRLETLKQGIRITEFTLGIQKRFLRENIPSILHEELGITVHHTTPSP